VTARLDDPGLFGRQWAAAYDGPGNPDPTPAVEFLAGLAAGGPALELAIGSGRVALPLAALGVAVEGIEASPEMVGLLRGKPGGDGIPVVVGDMADVAVDGPGRSTASPAERDRRRSPGTGPGSRRRCSS